MAAEAGLGRGREQDAGAQQAAEDIGHEQRRDRVRARRHELRDEVVGHGPGDGECERDGQHDAFLDGQVLCIRRSRSNAGRACASIAARRAAEAAARFLALSSA